MKNKVEDKVKKHPRINKVSHKYEGISNWEDIFENIIINHLRIAKRLDL